MRQILAITVLVFIATACSSWVEPDPELVITDSYTTGTPTPTVPPPLVLGLHFEATTVPNLPPTATPMPGIDTILEPNLLPWLPVTLP
jgi:hypothetical protein